MDDKLRATLSEQHRHHVESMIPSSQCGVNKRIHVGSQSPGITGVAGLCLQFELAPIPGYLRQSLVRGCVTHAA